MQRDRVRISPTLGSLSIFTAILIVGLIATLIGVSELVLDQGDGDSTYFALVGFIALAVGAIPICRAGGHDLLSSNRSVWRKPLFGRGVQLSGTVKEIQVIAKSVRGVNTAKPFRSCEMNLVISDIERINVLQDGNIERIRKEARKVSNLLGVPVVEDRRVYDA